MSTLNLKKSSPRSKFIHNVAVIGSGVIGCSTAWHLATLGYEVTLIDSQLNQDIDRSSPINGTKASLGLLMGYVFKRSTGRSWKLRKRSMELWETWLEKLNTEEYPLTFHTPLIRLAKSKEEAISFKELIKNRKDSGLEFIPTRAGESNERVWPTNNFGGIISHKDGRIEPLQLLKCLFRALDRSGVTKIADKVNCLQRENEISEKRWSIYLENGEVLKLDIVVICSALGSQALLDPLGHSRPITPVLGQVIELEITDNHKNWSGWPAVLNSEGINLIPNGNNRILIGATLEPGEVASNKELDDLKKVKGTAPSWLKESSIINQWSGLRARPCQQPAPILEQLEPGLIMATGHYRNGILLAPATAECVGNIIKEEN